MAAEGKGSATAEEQYAAVKTSVWWDIENCHVPKGGDGYVIAQNISRALADSGYKGAVTISSYGDTNKIPTALQHALSSTGIALNHVPAGVKDASDKKILVDMLFWAVDNPPPANYLLISGDRDFSNALHQLRMRRYNILLAQPPNVSQALVAAAKCVWNWRSLLVGGGPIQDSESSYHENVLSSKPSHSEAGKKTDGDPNPGNSNMENGNNYGNGRADNWQENQAWRNQVQSNASVSRTSSNELRQLKSGNKEGHDVQQPNCHSLPMNPKSVAQERTQSSYTRAPSSFVSPQKPHNEPSFSRPFEGRQFNAIPHEFFGTNKPKTAEDPSYTDQHPPRTDGPSVGYYPSHPAYPINASNNQIQRPQLLRPSDLPPFQPSQAAGNYTRSNSHISGVCQLPIRSSAPTFRPRPFTSLPDINSLKISEYSSCYDQNTSFPQQNQRPQLLRPCDLPPSQPSQAAGNYTRSNSHISGACQLPIRSSAQTFRPRPFTSLPDINSVNISEYSNCYDQNTSFPQQNSKPDRGNQCVPPFHFNNAAHPRLNSVDTNTLKTGTWGSVGYPMQSDVVQELIGKVLQTLEELKSSKITPTEANIVDCTRFGKVAIPNFNVRLALDYAIQHNLVVKHTLGANLPFYIKKDDKLWRCVNHLDTAVQYPKATWDAVESFLSSVPGQAAILASECRYHAATILHNSCLNHLVLGEALQILNTVVSLKKWIIPFSSGWKPVAVPLRIVSDGNVDIGCSTKMEPNYSDGKLER